MLSISLALQRPADMLLMDDRAGVTVARSRGIRCIGTLGLMVQAAERGLTDLEDALAALGRTNFRWSRHLRGRLLRQHGQVDPSR